MKFFVIFAPCHRCQIVIILFKNLLHNVERYIVLTFWLIFNKFTTALKTWKTYRKILVKKAYFTFTFTKKNTFYNTSSFRSKVFSFLVYTAKIALYVKRTWYFLRFNIRFTYVNNFYEIHTNSNVRFPLRRLNVRFTDKVWNFKLLYLKIMKQATFSTNDVNKKLALFGH